MTLTAIPARFFDDVLPLIDDLAEMQVVLFCFWALPQKEQTYPYLLRQDFARYDALMQGLRTARPEADPTKTLDAALNRAVTHHILLCAPVTLDGEAHALYFLNTERGRKGIAQVEAGHWQPGDLHRPVEILPERPNIYTLYEQNIGPLTPMIAEELKDAEATFPVEWITEAIKIAVKMNKRSWRYARAILVSWQTEGRTDSERKKQDNGPKFTWEDIGQS